MPNINLPQMIVQESVHSTSGDAAGPSYEPLLSKLGPEARLLIQCFRAICSSSIPPSGRALLESGDWGGDWDLFYELAYRHHGIRAAYLGLVNSEVPEHVASRTRLEAMNASATALGHIQDLLGILERFGEAEVPVIPLKGPVLANVLYGDMGARLSSDLDIIVRPEDLGRARQLLLRMGYDSPYREVPEDVLLKTEKDVPFFKRGHVPVEVHWALFEEYHNFQFPAVWGRLVELSFGSRQVPSLPWDVYLVYLCVHGSKHVWRRLSWIADVARVLETQSSEQVQAAEGLARKFRSERMLLLGVGLADVLFNAHGPPALMQRARNDRKVQILVRQVVERQIEGDPTDRIDEAGFHVRMRDSILDIPRYLRHLTELASISSGELSSRRRAVRAVARTVLMARKVFFARK